MVDHLRRLFNHMAWADSQALTSLHGVSSPRAIVLFAHILGAEHTWVSRIRGVTAELAIWPDLTLPECESWAMRNHSEYTDVLSQLDESALDRQVEYRTSQGVSSVSTISDILFQVALHGSYHRGQVAASIRELGGTPASTDFIHFARATP